MKYYPAAKDYDPVQRNLYERLKAMWDEFSYDNDVQSNRNSENVKVRYAFMVAIAKFTGLTNARNAAIFERDHSTISVAKGVHEKNLRRNKLYAEYYDLAKRKVREVDAEGFTLDDLEPNEALKKAKAEITELELKLISHEYEVEKLQKERDVFYKQYIDYRDKYERVKKLYEDLLRKI